MRIYKNKVTNLGEWEEFLIKANKEDLYFCRVSREFIDLADINEITAQQISVVENMFDTDLRFIVGMYGENSI